MDLSERALLDLSEPALLGAGRGGDMESLLGEGLGAGGGGGGRLGIDTRGKYGRGFDAETLEGRGRVLGCV